MLMDGYMLTGRVGVGSHKRVEDELFIIWFVYLCQSKAKEDRLYWGHHVNLWNNYYCTTFPPLLS